MHLQCTARYMTVSKMAENVATVYPWGRFPVGAGNDGRVLKMMFITFGN